MSAAIVIAAIPAHDATIIETRPSGIRWRGLTDIGAKSMATIEAATGRATPSSTARLLMVA